MTDALLLMDIQNGVVGRFGAGDDYLDRVVAAEATAEAVGIPVILVRVGFCPSGVVLSTVREAADLDYRITVLADLCLDADEEVHRVLTEKVFPRQATVIDSTQWLGH
jgi:nicotinamidase-related amidase